MGTNVEQIYDIALVTINDYQIDALAKVDYNAFLQYLRGFLITGLPEFTGDVLGELEIEEVKTINDSGEETTHYEFTRDLTSKEISIIAKTMVYKWFLKVHQDLKLLRGHLGIKEFKQLEISAGMKQRSEQLDKLKEDIQYDITQFQLLNLDKFWGLDA